MPRRIKNGSKTIRTLGPREMGSGPIDLYEIPQIFFMQHIGIFGHLLVITDIYIYIYICLCVCIYMSQCVCVCVCVCADR